MEDSEYQNPGTVDDESGEPNIPIPEINDADKFQEWLSSYIKRPSKGYEDLRHKDGSELSYEELLEKTREQLIIAVEDFKTMGLSDDSIAQYAVEQAQILSNTHEENR